MKRPFTHYDVLKVAHDAPPEVIRAAYRALSQKFHPDHNPDDPNAARIMAIVNASYEVLSDPGKREAYDRLLLQQANRTEQTASTGAAASPRPSGGVPSHGSDPERGINPTVIVRHLFRYWILYAVAGFFAWAFIFDTPRTPPPGPKPYSATPVPPRPTRPPYVRPAVAPNGEPWPITAGYIKGYDRLHRKGLSSVTVDNSRNDSDVFVKLVSLDGPQAYPTRHVFIPAFGSFTLSKVTAGSYDIRYRDLSSGGLSRSEAFVLEETSTSQGTQYSVLTMTLYKVKDGNMQTFDLSEDEF